MISTGPNTVLRAVRVCHDTNINILDEFARTVNDAVCDEDGFLAHPLTDSHRGKLRNAHLQLMTRREEAFGTLRSALQVQSLLPHEDSDEEPDTPRSQSECVGHYVWQIKHQYPWWEDLDVFGGSEPIQHAYDDILVGVTNKIDGTLRENLRCCLEEFQELMTQWIGE